MCSRHQGFLLLFNLLVWQRLTYRESLRCQQKDHAGETAIILGQVTTSHSFWKYSAACTLVLWAKLQNWGGMILMVWHLTSKTLFESQSWKKCEQAAKTWQNFGIVEPGRTTKLKKKWGRGRANVLTNLSSIQSVCRQKLERAGKQG